MKILRAYKTELGPNNRQRTALLRHAGAARWTYNWGLARKIESYTTTGKSPSAMDLHKDLVALKSTRAEDGGVPWLYGVSKCAPQIALQNLDKAYSGFFHNCKSGKKQKGFPRFKARKSNVGSFSLTGLILIKEKRIRLPNLGSTRLKEHGYLPVSGVKILRATVSEKAGRWFVALNVEQDICLDLAPDCVIGVDVGINSLAVTSDGVVFENPKALKKSDIRLRLLQKSVSRKKKGSANRKKAMVRLAKQHYRVSCIRKDSTHKVSAAIAKQARTVVIESLDVIGMMKNHRLARSIADASLAELHRQIRYKTEWRGGTVVRADRYYKSSKTCSSCGLVNDRLTLADRMFVCTCGSVIDRDLNASLNLKQLAASYAVTACCPGGSDSSNTVKLLVGQELSTVKSCASRTG